MLTIRIKFGNKCIALYYIYSIIHFIYYIVLRRHMTSEKRVAENKKINYRL